MTDPSLALPDLLPGSVWLVGAGPGDPGLLTLLALHGLRAAEVVVHDALVDPRILALAGPAARLENAGKRGGTPSPRQAEITDRLIALARAGARVVRLKGGDPFVFGRGAEEAMALAAAGIPCRVVPGITAGIGGLAYAGIPATAGETNAAITFVTGHGASGALPPELDWPALAAQPVVVFYMGLRQLDQIAARLIAAGRDPATPCAVVSRATTPAQQVIEAPLAQVAAAACGVPAPAVLVIGAVVGLRPRLALTTT